MAVGIGGGEGGGEVAEGVRAEVGVEGNGRGEVRGCRWRRGG